MRTKMKPHSPERALTKLLDAVEFELMHASDEEIRDAASDLGMNLSMKDSAAFSGLRYPGKPQLSDFFELDEMEHRSLSAVTDLLSLQQKSKKESD